MQRRKFSREFKLEAVKLVRERGVSVSQAARLVVRERDRRYEIARASEEQLRLILDSARDYPIITTDLDRRITS